MKEWVAECIQRRSKLADALPSNSLGLWWAASKGTSPTAQRCGFFQEQNFFYLTGCAEPGAALVLRKDRSGQSTWSFFCLPEDPFKTQWGDTQLGPEAHKATLAFEEAYPINQLPNYLKQWLPYTASLYCALGLLPEKDALLNQWLSDLLSQNHLQSQPNWFDCRPLLALQRSQKSAYELTAMRKAAEVTADAHLDVMCQAVAGMNENQVAALFAYQVQLSGAHGLAYPTIAASGKNSCILHYRNNNDTLKRNEVFLLDAGAEYLHYAADVTRTFPVGKRFTAAQQAVYEIVLATQETIIKELKPGITWTELEAVAKKMLTLGLKDLGILKGSLDGLLEAQAYKPYYMHSVGHYLGLAVHDLGPEKHNRMTGEEVKLLENNCLTIEPGLYFSPNLNIPEKLKGIGIRIEDDVLITGSGHEVLTANAPKSVAEIHALRSKAE